MRSNKNKNVNDYYYDANIINNNNGTVNDTKSSKKDDNRLSNDDGGSKQNKSDNNDSMIRVNDRDDNSKVKKNRINDPIDWNTRNNLRGPIIIT